MTIIDQQWNTCPYDVQTENCNPTRRPTPREPESGLCNGNEFERGIVHYRSVVEGGFTRGMRGSGRRDVEPIASSGEFKWFRDLGQVIMDGSDDMGAVMGESTGDLAAH